MATDFRDACFDRLSRLAASDPNIYVLTNDMGAIGLDALRQQIPQRVINAGIAEQNMISVAAGLALTGKKVFVYGIISHLTGRPYEQIKLDVCAMNLPVVILGVGAGLSYGTDGPTHHGLHDISLMYTLPNIRIYNPSDARSASEAVHLCHEQAHPGYVRLDKEQVEDFEDDGHDFRIGMRLIGRADGDLCVVSSGVLLHALRRVTERLRAEGIGVRLIDCYRLKPFNRAVFTELTAQAEGICVIEEHAEYGALGDRVAAWAAESGYRGTFGRRALPDELFMGSASRKWAHERWALTESALMDVLRQQASVRSPRGRL